MNQNWKKGVKLKSNIVKQCNKIKPIDILVGVICKDVEATVLNVLNVINEGLYRYFPEHKKAIAISKGPSSDRTSEVVDLFYPYNSVHKIVTEDLTIGGKGVGVMTVLEIAHETNAKSVVLIDGDLLSVKPGWIEAISNPIIYGRADLTVPYYIRDKYDAVITNNLVYPFTRALYGIDIRQPIAGEFGLSKNLYEILRKHPLFPPDFGIDIFIVTVAAAEKMVLKESLFSIKIHESTTRYLEPEKFLIPMFRTVTKKMFELAEYYEEYWKNKEIEYEKKLYRECFSQKPIPVRINISELKKSFKTGFIKSKKLIEKTLPKDIIIDLQKIAKNNERFDPELWAEIVYNYTAAYKNLKSENEKYQLLESLKTLWIGRFVNYAIKAKDLDINEAEQLIQKQAEIFEEKINYLRSIY